MCFGGKARKSLDQAKVRIPANRSPVLERTIAAQTNCETVYKRTDTRLDEVQDRLAVKGRQGGDEFALVLPETGMAAATLVGHRICDLAAKDAEEPRLSVSVGIVSFPKDADTIATLLYAADKALYVMKHKRAAARVS